MHPDRMPVDPALNNRQSQTVRGAATRCWGNEEDAVLRAFYGKNSESTRFAIDFVLGLHPDWPRRAVVDRARQLNVSRSKSDATAAWKPGEILLLRELQGRPVRMIARRLGRSEAAVRSKLKRLGMGADFFGGYKTKDLMEWMAVPEGTVETWLAKGWIRRECGRITANSVEAFCLERPVEAGVARLHPDILRFLAPKVLTKP